MIHPRSENPIAPNKRTQVPLSSALDKKLVGYGIAATAAGVGMLAAAQPAQAKIVYTPANVKVVGNYFIDLNHDGINDFSLWHSAGNNGSTGSSFLAIYPNPIGNGAIGSAQGWFRQASALRRGSLVGPGVLFNGSPGAMAQHIKKPIGSDQYSTYWNAPWANGGAGLKNHYLGLTFQIKGKTHFGWARVTVTTIPNDFGFTATLRGYAYETKPNKPIIAGKTKGPAETNRAEPASLRPPVVHHGTLGVLATGASGLPVWRRTAQ
jgi:hypothetical protein